MRIFIVCLITALQGRAQTAFKSVKLEPSSIMAMIYGQSEPSIAIDPKNPNIIAAGAILNEYYYSMDGGETWKSTKLKSKYGVWGDPVLMFDTTGKFYYFHLANYKKTSWIDRIVCQSSNSVDGKFNQGTFPKPNGTKAQDKHWTVLDPATNTIYMTWTQFDAYDSKDPKDRSIIVFSKSADQGATWSDPIMVMQRSLDGGKTWLAEEQQLHVQHGGWELKIPGMFRANGLPILVSDLSNGLNRGNLYLNWCDQKNGENDTDSWLSVSKDGGENWSEPVKVNQDDSKRHQFFTWMTVDQSNGNLYFLYYDRRNYSDARTDVYVTMSADGGQTFHDVKINDTPFIPNEKVFFGDYLNIAAVNGVIRPIWPRMDEGKISLWVTLLTDELLLQNQPKR